MPGNRHHQVKLEDLNNKGSKASKRFGINTSYGQQGPGDQKAP